MNFDYTNEQSLLKEAAGRFVADRYDFRTRTRCAASDAGFEAANWKTFADLGWLALGFEETYGGMLAADVELMVLAEAFGRGLVLEPFYSTVVLGGRLLTLAASASQKERIIPKLIAGEGRIAVAFAEARRGYDLVNVDTRLVPGGNNYRLIGEKAVVFDAPSADYIIATARAGDTAGLSLVVIPAKADGVRRRDFVTTDGRRASEIVFAGVQIDASNVLGTPGEALSVVEEAADRMVAVSCADAVGAMDQALSMTLEYVKTRKQFGSPIGKFQALQHRLADMYVSLELARSMAIYANLSLNKPASERKAAVSLAKMQVIESARLIGRQSIQLHGGIGMTNEYPIGHYFKRLLAFETLFGDADYHAARVESLQAA